MHFLFESNYDKMDTGFQDGQENGGEERQYT